MELSAWTIEFVKARDALRRTLIDYSQDGDLITFQHKNKVHHFQIAPVLIVPNVKDVFTVVCLNTEENLSFLLQHWSDFCGRDAFVVFVEPVSGGYWQIHPRTHSLVADPDSLEQGLRSLGEGVLRADV
jgi:hypothetical protein